MSIPSDAATIGRGRKHRHVCFLVSAGSSSNLGTRDNVRDNVRTSSLTFCWVKGPRTTPEQISLPISPNKEGVCTHGKLVVCLNTAILIPGIWTIHRSYQLLKSSEPGTPGTFPTNDLWWVSERLFSWPRHHGHLFWGSIAVWKT